MSNGFEGKVAVVTGAGGGLGRSHALALAKLGAKVVVNDLGGNVHGDGKSDMASKVVEEIKAAGGEAIANHASVSDKAGAKSIIQDAVDHFGGIDILVNNAGILRDKSFKKMTLDEIDLVVQVHLLGTFYVTHAAWPIMYEQNYGRIVFTSSGSGIFGNFGQANYGAAKMGMLGLMNVLAKEGASRNIRVNCLSPGAATRMTASIPGRDIDPNNPPADRGPALVTPAVLLMCAEDAPTGKTIQAAGGRFASVGVFSNKGVSFGVDASFEKLHEAKDVLLDMSEAKEGNQRRRPAAKEEAQ